MWVGEAATLWRLVHFYMKTNFFFFQHIAFWTAKVFFFPFLFSPLPYDSCRHFKFQGSPIGFVYLCIGPYYFDLLNFILDFFVTFFFKFLIAPFNLEFLYFNFSNLILVLFFYSFFLAFFLKNFQLISILSFNQKF
jgi:hypothetical protein